MIPLHLKGVLLIVYHRIMVKGEANSPGRTPTGRRKWKKPKDKPKRPLSAYNFFFAHERRTIKQNLEVSKAAARNGHQEQDKSPEALGFSGLAKHVADKWKTLDSATKKPYEDEAKIEKLRYTEAITVWKARQEVSKRQISPSPDSELRFSKPSDSMDSIPISLTAGCSSSQVEPEDAISDIFLDTLLRIDKPNCFMSESAWKSDAIPESNDHLHESAKVQLNNTLEVPFHAESSYQPAKLMSLDKVQQRQDMSTFIDIQPYNAGHIATSYPHLRSQLGIEGLALLSPFHLGGTPASQAFARHGVLGNTMPITRALIDSLHGSSSTSGLYPPGAHAGGFKQQSFPLDAFDWQQAGQASWAQTPAAMAPPGCDTKSVSMPQPQQQAQDTVRQRQQAALTEVFAQAFAPTTTEWSQAKQAEVVNRKEVDATFHLPQFWDINR